MNIYCLHGSHVSKELEPYIQTQRGFIFLFSSCSGNARGVAIILNNNFLFTLHKTKTDNSGNYIIVDITIEGVYVRRHITVNKMCRVRG